MTFSGISPEAAWWIMAVWFAALGGAVGSFLNVVIYRLPAGKSLVYPPSHCPACQHPIRWYDNVPVASWFVLRGRCRDCRARISPRYPLVEAVTAGMFLLVGLVEFQSGGANLPNPAQGTGPAELKVAQLAGISLYHVVLVCALLAAGLIELDGYVIPRRLVLPVVAVGVLAGALWPPLHPVPAVQTVADSVIARTSPLIGLAAGALLGLVLWQSLGQRRKTGDLYGPALAGTFLGWQAAVALTVGAAVVHVPLVLTRRNGRGASTVDFPRPAKNQPYPGPRISLALWLAPLSLAWILLWGPIVRASAVLG